VKRFACPICAAELHFVNSVCLRCGAAVALDSRGFDFVALADGGAPCANRAAAGCNWLALDGADRCPACRHNRTIPDLSVPGNAENWREIEKAKRYLFYSLITWRLPHPTRGEADGGLCFDFLADQTGADGTVTRVMTGHAEGVITLNIAEADAAERVARRQALGEPYRTLIGHMRHEVGHYYWNLLIRDGGRLAAFRAVFGDERADYAAALAAHYERGPQKRPPKGFISAYAASHPWEDWAETWAHYFHIVDASETAHAFGMRLHDGTQVDRNPYTDEDFTEILADWVPLTVAMNCLNRSLGQPDLYPFVLSQPVKEKLRFIHDLIRETAAAG